LEFFFVLLGKLSPYLETSHLIENFVNDWYLTTITQEVSNMGNSLKCSYF